MRPNEPYFYLSVNPAAPILFEVSLFLARVNYIKFDFQSDI